MRVGPIIACLAVAVSGCTDTVDLVAANPQAQAAGGLAQLHFSRGLPFGVAKFVMPDGENVPAEFRVDETPPATPSGPVGNFHAFGRGSRTQMVCLGTVIAGHGSADCQTQDGALYKLTM